MAQIAKPDLERDGYAVLRDRLSGEARGELRTACLTLIPHQKNPLDPLYLDRAAIPRIVDECCDMVRASGLSAGPRPHTAWVMNKVRGEGRRPYHNDWQWWHLDLAFAPRPSRIGFFLYGVPTSPANGCLRVIPGSHRRFVPGVHEHARPFSTHPEEIDVTAELGDVVVFDARLLHATHSNDTDENRPAITFWADIDDWPKEPTDCDAAAAFRRKGLST